MICSFRRSRPAALVHTAVLFVLAPLSAAAQQNAQPASTQAAAQSSAQITPVQTVPTVPFPNRFNEVLPPWLRVRGEFRERMEGFDGGGFNDTREDLYWLSRFRFNVGVTPSKNLSFQAQVQDARVAKKTVGPTGTPFNAPFDLRMGYADIGSATSRFAFRVGRQELVYGEQRLVGHVSWLNAARSFDGAKVTFRSKAFQMEAFGASVVRILQDEFDKSGAGNRFAGAYGTAGTLIPKGSFEPYVFWKRDVNQRGELGSIDDLQHTTAGARLVGRLPAGLDYGIEMAVQRGSLGSDDVRAWGGHWQLRQSLQGAGAVRLTAEYNYASGDENPRDGVRGTFDQLYPTPHDKYGLADQFGWKNLRHARGGVEFTPRKGYPITTNYHAWWLAQKNDSLYGAGSAPIARVPTGAESSYVGQEIDVQIARALTPQIQIAGGYAHIFAGDFLKEATPGADYSYPFVMLTYVFLAEK